MQRRHAYEPHRYRIRMQSEYQSPESRTAAIEGSYSYTETVGHSLERLPRTDSAPSEFFRYRVIKRSLDVLLVLILMPVILLVLGLVSAVVRISSPGPIFYSHRRIRKGGAFFSMWKFRTMCVNSAEVLEDYLAEHPEARAEWNKTHKLREDPRITRLGVFLRRYSLDELPQLWNVMMGQMSLVGPRPIVAAEVEKYGECFDCYCRVKPGLTGLWQVSGRSALSYEARVSLDCEYVERWSLTGDFVILLKTFSSVVNQDGAF
jgi:lipopolysaccharide/colanic/teichoic acid biosynthesis glycosyltransferase